MRSLKIAALLGLIMLIAAFMLPAGIRAETEYTGSNFSLVIPEGWELVEEDAQGQLQEFIFLVPEDVEALEADEFHYATNVNVVVEELAADFTLEEYLDIVLRQVEGRLEEFELLSRRPATMAGIEGLTVEYVGLTDAGEELSWQEWVVISEDSAYVVSYSARRDRFADFREDVELILESFAFQ